MDAGEPLVTVHASDRGRLEHSLALLRDAIQVAPEAPPARELLRAVLR